MSQVEADRNLLIGVLALQMGFVSREELIAVVGSWALDRRRPLEQVLSERGLLSESHRRVLDPLVQVHLALDGGGSTEPSRATDRPGSPDHAEIPEPTPVDSGPNEVRGNADGPVNGDARAEPSATQTDATLTLPAVRPERAGRFRQLRPLGRGNLGVVTVALDVELNREVALKEIRENLADLPESRARFLLEAELTGRLEHPGVVPVYGLGRGAGDRPFYAMRLIRGETLKHAIERLHHAHRESGHGSIWRSLELIQLLRRFLQVCDTMAYAHSRGVIHRDVKPANIMLGPFGETLVVDWGLAKVVGHPDEPASNAAEETLRPATSSGSSETLAGTVVGTPAYMSPEQAAGRLDELGPASDIYSLGATLLVLLTGQPPMEGREAASVLERVRRGEVLNPRRIVAGLPRALEAICRKAMALRPEDRYASAADLACDLEHWLADEPVSARREGWSDRLGRWSRRHRSWIRAGAAALGLVAAATSVASVAVFRAWTDAVEARGLERKAKSEALRFASAERKQHALAQRRLNETELLTARLMLDRSLQLCQIGDINAGLLWMVEALEISERARGPLGPVIRTNLAAWSRGNSRLLHALKHPGPIGCVAIRQDGRLMATGSADGLRLFDPIAGRPIGEPLRGVDLPVSSLVFLGDGHTLAAGSWSGTVRRFDTTTGEPVGEPLREVGPVTSLALSPNGKWLATAGSDGERKPMAHVWDLTTGQPVGPPMWHPKGVTVLDVAFHPDGGLLATASEDGVARLWDAATGKLTAIQVRHELPLQVVAFHPDRHTLLTGGQDGVVRSWDVSTGQRTVHPDLVHQEAISDIAVSPDGQLILTASWDATARLWDAATGEPIGPALPHRHALSSAAFSADGSFFVTAGNDRLARVWSPPAEPPGRVFLQAEAPIRLVVIHPDGHAFLSLEGASTVRLRDIHTGQPLGLAVEESDEVSDLGISPDGRRFLTVSDTTIHLRDTATGRLVGEPMTHEDRLRDFAFSPDSRLLLTGTRKGLLRAWDTETGRLLREPMLHPRGITRIGFAPPESTPVTGCDDGQFRFWDLASGQVTGAAIPLGDAVRSFAISPDARSLVLGGMNGTTRIWELPSRTARGSMMGHVGPVTGLAFSFDGKAILSMGVDVIQRWDATTREPIPPVLPYQGPVRHWALGPTQDVAISGRADGIAQAWDLATATPIGPPLKHTRAITWIAFHPQGTLALTCDGSGFLRRWPRSEPLADDVPTIRAKIQVLTGTSLKSGVAQALEGEDWDALRERLPVR